MAVGKRLSKVAGEFNVGINTIVDFLHKKGFEIEFNPNTKVTEEMFSLLEKEYKSDLTIKKESEKLGDRKNKPKKESISIEDIKPSIVEDEEDEDFQMPTAKNSNPAVDIKVVGKIDLETTKPKKKEDPIVAKETPKAQPKPEPAPVEIEQKQEVEATPQKKEPKKEAEHIPVITEKIGEEIKVVGKIDLDAKPSINKTEQKTAAPQKKDAPMAEKTTEPIKKIASPR